MRAWLVVKFFCLHMLLAAWGRSKQKHKDKVDVCGGWDCQPSKTVKERYGTLLGRSGYSCDLHVFDNGKMLEDVQSDLGWMSKPFIIRNGSTLERDGFKKQHLLKHAKKNNMSVLYGYSWTIVQQDGSAKEEMRFDEFVADHMYAKRYDGETMTERPYVFHGFSPLLGISGTQFGIPPAIYSWQEKANLTFSKHSATPNLMIGAALSGVGFHRHSSALQMSAYGYKRWLLYPPGRSPPGGAMVGDWPVYDWMDKVYPSLRDDLKPFECVQEPGDVMWIPEAWYHATLNLGDTVAVSILHNDLRSEPFALTNKAIMLEHGTQKLRHMRKIMKLQPNNTDDKSALAIELALHGKVAEAQNLLYEVLKQDAFHMTAMVTMIEIFENKVEAKHSKAKKQLQSVLKAFVPSLQANTRSWAANRLLARYYELIGNQAKVAEYDNRLEFLKEMGISERNIYGPGDEEQDL